jgi:selenide, water dikinase
MLPPSPEEQVRLTAYSHGAGCGCKIAPAVLDRILGDRPSLLNDPRLLVGYGSRDDAAVYDIGNGRALISTTDFFSPIVDDAYDFGRVASVNAISDVYAMGGRPLLAVAILGWPVEKLPAELAARVLDGAREACREAGIALAGGHSIDAPEPFFGLAVTGEAPIAHIKRNNTPQENDLLVLTKPLGVGILTTAAKRGKLRPEHAHLALEVMLKHNSAGMELGALEAVHAMTDVTGFGLFGHVIELCGDTGLGAIIDHAALPIIPEALTYLSEGCYPDGSFRNWKSSSAKVSGAGAMDIMMLGSDPQTSGGLLLSVDAEHMHEVNDILSRHHALSVVIGKIGRTRDISTTVEILSTKDDN